MNPCLILHLGFIDSLHIMHVLECPINQCISSYFSHADGRILEIVGWKEWCHRLRGLSVRFLRSAGVAPLLRDIFCSKVIDQARVFCYSKVQVARSIVKSCRNIVINVFNCSCTNCRKIAGNIVRESKFRNRIIVVHQFLLNSKC